MKYRKMTVEQFRRDYVVPQHNGYRGVGVDERLALVAEDGSTAALIAIESVDNQYFGLVLAPLHPKNPNARHILHGVDVVASFDELDDAIIAAVSRMEMYLAAGPNVPLTDLCGLVRASHRNPALVDDPEWIKARDAAAQALLADIIADRSNQ